MAQHSVQLNLKGVKYGGMHHFPGEIITRDDDFLCENFSPCVQSESPQN